ncbi:MAG: POTRA domain-containing protein, partial [Myxococcota bacterium]
MTAHRKLPGDAGVRSVRVELGDRVARASRVLAVAVCLGAGALHAQGIRPADQRPELEDIEAAPPVELSLPPLPEASGSASPRLSQGLRVSVSRIVVEGVTAFPPERIAHLVEGYESRTLLSEDLVSLRDALTALYVDHGYITSGAVIPDQDVDGGVVRVRVIEGRLGSISIEGEDGFRADYFRDRLRRAGRTPVNVQRLEALLQVFQRDTRLRAVHGRLLPGAQRGVSDFLLRIEEARPYELMLGFANDTPPSLGGEQGNINARFWNLLGRGDELIAGFRGGEGLRDYRVDVSLPINTYDTRVGAHARFTKGVVVEEPFDVLDVKSTASTYGIQLRQPILRGASQSLELGLIAELRDQDSKVAGFEFCTIEGALDCDVRIAVLRPFAEWIWRARDDAVALRSTLSLGLHAFGSTDNPSHVDLPDERRIPVPDSRFTVWLGQLEWVHHFPSRWWGGLLLVRGTVQLSADPLLSIE